MSAPRSLQGRLLVLVLGLVGAVWIATAVLTWYDVRHELDELLDGHLAQAAALLVVQQVDDIEHDHDDRGVDAPTLHRYAPKVAFQVFHESRLVARSSNAPVHAMVPPGEPWTEGFRSLDIDGVAWRVFTARGAERDVQVYVGEQATSRSSILMAVLRSMLWPVAVALPLLGLAVWWAVHSGVAPLRSLGRTLAARQPGALQPVQVDDAPSEMAPMLAELNGLFQRISTLMDAERRFTADAAHELRTPIAAIRAQAQVALGEADATGRRKALTAAVEGCDRAARLVEQLLTLARLEAGAAAPTALVDLTALARHVVAEIAPKALAKRQTLSLDAPAGACMRGDETLLGVLLRNLIDNAVRYSPPAASVQVQVALERETITLRVQDGGPGLSDADIARLGDRFFRRLGSDESGSGLGWSIVRRIAAVGGASMQVTRSASLGGLDVRVTWPRAADGGCPGA